jgi:predicted phosphodiesterase
MKIICISDTHGQHQNLKLPEGDMIIHAGDVSGRGKPDE